MKKVLKKRNPEARALRSPLFKPKIVKDKKKYNRKKLKDKKLSG